MSCIDLFSMPEHWLFVGVVSGVFLWLKWMFCKCKLFFPSSQSTKRNIPMLFVRGDGVVLVAPPLRVGWSNKGLKPSWKVPDFWTVVHVSIMSQNSVCVFYRMFLLVLLKGGGKGNQFVLQKVHVVNQSSVKPNLISEFMYTAVNWLHCHIQ